MVRTTFITLPVLVKRKVPASTKWPLTSRRPLHEGGTIVNAGNSNQVLTMELVDVGSEDEERCVG